MNIKILPIAFILLVACESHNHKKDTDLNSSKNSISHQQEENDMTYSQLINEGRNAIDENNPHEALEKYLLALNIDSSRIEVLYGLGVTYTMNCYASATNCDEGIYYLSKAIQSDSNYRNSFYNRSVCKTIIGDFNGALEDINYAINLNPDDPDYYNNRGTIKLSLGDSVDAYQDYEHAMVLRAKTTE